MPNTTGAPGRTSCTKAQAGQRLRQYLGEDASQGHRRHGAGQNEGRDHRGLIVPGIDLGGAEHGGIVGHGRIGVDQAHHHRVALHERIAEQDLRHIHRILGPLGMGDGPHEWLVAELDVAVHHIQMALVDRQVHRLAEGAAGMMQPRAQVGELDEVAEILNGRVAAPFVQTAHEGRAIGRGQHRAVAADDCVAGWIAGALRELPGGAGLDDGPAQALGEMHPRAIHPGAALPQNVRAPPGRRGIRFPLPPAPGRRFPRSARGPVRPAIRSRGSCVR